MLKNNPLFIKNIREETDYSLKDIIEVIGSFEKYNCVPEKQDIIDVLRYKQISSKTKNPIKSEEEYIKEIYENKYKKE